MSLGRRLRGWLSRGKVGGVEPDPAELAALDQRFAVGEADPADADLTAPPGWVEDPAKRYPPLVNDPRVASRTAASQLLGYPGLQASGDASRLAERYWGLPADMPDENALGLSLNAARQVWKDTRPGDAIEALRWSEQVGRPQTSGDIEVSAVDPLRWWEVASLRFSPRSLAVLEQLATYYRAQPITDEGSPTGDLFVGCGQCDLLATATHPDGGSLSVSWALLRLATIDDGPPIVGVETHKLPAADSDLGLPRRWDDLRFGWGGRYTKDLRCVVRGDGGSTLRLFVGLQASASFRVAVRGRLAGWNQIAGPLGAALKSVQSRD